MKPVDRQKICSSCDGRIPLNAKECIYCGIDQPEQKEASSFKQQTLQESLSSLYAPPYAAKNHNGFYSQAEPQEEIHKDSLVNTAILNEEEENVKSNFLPLFFLVVGTNLFTIGLLQLFFSTEGLLTLEWNSRYWFFYCLTALPMCYFGYKKATS